MTSNTDPAAEIARLTAERDVARAAAEEAERNRDELLSRVAHDLRGPLNSIFGWMQLLQSGRLDADRQRHALDAIARGIRAQTSLLDEMQRVSHTLRNRLELSLATLDPAIPVQRAIESVRGAADEKSIRISTALDRGLIVSGDAEQLTQLFERLLDNAVRCTPEHGRIDVRLAARGQDVGVSVRDTGIGIAPGDLADIFLPFRRAAPGTTPAHRRRGLGAGLALARHVAELHGGRIDAGSDGPGRGAEFVVHLPLAEIASRHGADQRPRDARAPQRHDTIRERLRLAVSSRTA
jgi:signal transduction histidine kinase